MASDQKDREDEPTSFVDELRDIQGEYLMLSELSEKEKSYGSKLADTMKLLQYEVDATIPLNRETLSDGTKKIKQAFLASDAVVIMVDEYGNTLSKPLDRFSPDMILSIVQDCTPELKRLLGEKRKQASLKVMSLEKVLRELKKAHAIFKQVNDDSGAVPQSGSADELSSIRTPEMASAPAKEISRETVAPVRPPVRQKDSKEEAFAFRASFLEKKQASDHPSELA